MKQKRITFILVAIGVLLVTGSVFLMTASPVKAQCGSQASSCKNCHEVQAQDPVNNDGTAWHTQHAFGDFCYLCHGGNNQATDKTAAHTGMVDPLSDVVTDCKSCHPTDYEAKAQVYATTLGVQIGTGSTSAASATAAPASGTPAPTSGGSTSSAPASTGISMDDPNLVNYNQRYDEIVLGKHPINWGNAILILMIAMFAVGGGAFVVYNEKLVNVSFGNTKKVEGEYPADVVDMLPSISGLKPQARKSLKNILDNPKKTEKVLGLIDEVVTDEKPED
jgi:hypothetical protein